MPSLLESFRIYANPKALNGLRNLLNGGEIVMPDNGNELLIAAIERTLGGGLGMWMAGREGVAESSAKSQIGEKLKKTTQKMALIYPIARVLADLFSRNDGVTYGFLMGGSTVRTIPSLSLFDKPVREVTVKEVNADRLADIDVAIFTEGVESDGEKVRLARRLNEGIPVLPDYADWRVDLNDAAIKSEGQVGAILSEMERAEQLGERDKVESLSALKQMRIPGSLFYRREGIEGVLIYKRDRPKTKFDESFEAFQNRYKLPRSFEGYLDETVRPYLRKAFQKFPDVKDLTIQTYPEHGEFFQSVR